MASHPYSQSSSVGPRRSAALVAAAVVCLAVAGALLWWRQGEAIFSTHLTAALAWCF